MNSLAAGVLKKICTTCGRQITWRKKWEKNWESITYCSDSCRRHKVKPNSLDTAFESRILALLHERKRILGPAAVVTCEEAEAAVLSELKSAPPTPAPEPSSSSQWGADRKDALASAALPAADADAGDSLAGNRQDSDSAAPARTRERCRQAARRLAARGLLLVTQDGKVVDPSFAKGVMELKLPS